MKAPVTAIVLTYNESANLGACLESLRGWTAAVFVVDSGSTDGTVAIAEQAGAVVVTHAFETHARQWGWAIETLPIATDWILALDADQRVTAELRDAIARAIAGGAAPAANGFFMARRQIFRGRWIRHGGYYPKYLLKLFRRGRVTLDDRDLVDHHFIVDGPVARLNGDLIEDNQNERAIADWTAKHNRYAVLQARQELRARQAPRAQAGQERRARADDEPVGLAALAGHPDARVRWLKQQWARLPLYVRPCVYVFYRYILRAGFLDGREGFVFHVLQGFWYRLLVDINIDEQRARLSEAPAPGSNGRDGARHDARQS